MSKGMARYANNDKNSKGYIYKLREAWQTK